MLRLALCTCFGAEILWPLDGATDVPLNTQIVAQHVHEGVSIVLETEDGTPVPLSTETHATITVATTPGLDPGTTYVFGVVSELSPPPGRRFITGDAPDNDPPVFGGLTSFATEAQLYDTCATCAISQDGRVSRIRLDHAPVSDAVRFELAVRRVGEAEAFSLMGLPPDHPSAFGHFRCGTIAPTLEPGASYCGRLSAFDAAGNAAGGDVEMCSETPECGMNDDLTCRPRDDECLPVAKGGCGCHVSRKSQSPWPLLAISLFWLIASPRRGRRSRPSGTGSSGAGRRGW